MMRAARGMLGVALVAAAAGAAQSAGAGAPDGPATVCTVTLNSADEARVLRTRLPAGRYRFVELVQADRPEWLRAACANGVRCDVLVVSGHFNAGEAFYAESIERSDQLVMDDLERQVCSESCPGVLSGLAEVYLLGCRSLDPEATKYASAYGESGLARMRRIFAEVPAIYGFAGSAPVGPAAATLLERYFDAGGGARFGSGVPDSRLLQAFSRHAMVRVGGAGPAQAAERSRICRFYDERTTPADKLRFMHGLLREGDVRHLKRMGRFLEDLGPAARSDPAFVEALSTLQADEATRARFLERAYASPQPVARVRMIQLAAALGWLSRWERAEQAREFAQDLMRMRAPGAEEVDLACELAASGGLDPAASGLAPLPADPPSAARSAILACLGDGEAHRETLRALAHAAEADVKAAEAYLRRRPVRDPAEVRAAARAVAQMPAGPAKVRALGVLARLPVADAQALEELARAFARESSAAMQEAIAEVFLRSGYRAPELAALLAEHRVSRPGEGGIVDALVAGAPHAGALR